MIKYYFYLLVIGVLIIAVGNKCFNYYSVIAPLVCYIIGVLIMAFAVINIIGGIV
ncbi:MAG: hypothetical protein ACRCX8_20090 [Sarcina sp.]